MNAQPRTRLVLLLAFWAFRPAAADEVQQHGLRFEHWVCDAFFDGYRGGAYTQQWDIPAEVNRRHGGLPVNPKAAKYGSPLGLGDALRQFQINEPFLLVAGFWEQESESVKKWVNAQVVSVTPAQWRRLWHPVTLEDLRKLDAVIKDPRLTLAEARAQAQAIKSKPPFSEAVITVNPKIDRSQRRLQCSLAFRAFFEHLAPAASRERQEAPVIWGKVIPSLPESGARQLSPK